VISIPGRVLDPLPRKVIVEKLAPLPPKPPAVIIEKWSDYFYFIFYSRPSSLINKFGLKTQIVCVFLNQVKNILIRDNCF